MHQVNKIRITDQAEAQYYTLEQFNDTLELLLSRIVLLESPKAFSEEWDLEKQYVMATMKPWNDARLVGVPMTILEKNDTYAFVQFDGMEAQFRPFSIVALEDLEALDTSDYTTVHVIYERYTEDGIFITEVNGTAYHCRPNYAEVLKKVMKDKERTHPSENWLITSIPDHELENFRKYLIKGQ